MQASETGRRQRRQCVGLSASGVRAYAGGIGSVTSRGREMDELRARLAQVELERDQAVADFNRSNAQLAQMEETQRTLHEHLYILKTKYDTVKVRTPRPATSARGLS